ncbi:MAG: RNA polymerase sigma factor [Bacteroidota bacterium]
MISDEAIIKGCVEGKRQMQKMLFQKYSPTMLGVCQRYSKDMHEAEDIMLEGFMLIFEKISQFKNVGSFEGWMKRIMVNLAISHYRKNLKFLYTENIIDFEIDAEIASPLENISIREILSTLEQLPEGYRLIFNLYVVEGYNHFEIAKKLSVSVGTSKSQLSKARKALQILLLNKENDI